MDQQALEFQKQLHEQNQTRLQKMEESQTEQGKAIARIEENTKHIPALVERITALELFKERFKGALMAVAAASTVLGAVFGAILTALVQWILHKFLR